MKKSITAAAAGHGVMADISPQPSGLSGETLALGTKMNAIGVPSKVRYILLLIYCAGVNRDRHLGHR